MQFRLDFLESNAEHGSTNPEVPKKICSEAE